ncbi:MAG: response regulator [Spirochaetia bacterium]|nr:response regulator [Spirochaetia bacterium]
MHNKTVLITDDENEMREELSGVLKDEGYKVFEAADGQAAMKVLKKHKIDVMLLDLKMPVMTGFEVLEELKKNRIKVKTIVLTGSILGSTLPDAKDISYTEKIRILKFADLVMNKPFDVVKLLGKIGQLAVEQ